jgi:hypothetical protein
MEEDEEKTAYDLPESTAAEIIEKIRGMAAEIRSDWSDPRNEYRNIWRLCDKAKRDIKNIMVAGLWRKMVYGSRLTEAP